MTLIMGIDTGGTYTDGVIVDPAVKKILCKSKVFTAKHDLVSSIEECVSNLILPGSVGVSMVCLSTTLATNAIVEGRRGRVALLLTGGRPEGPLPADPCIELSGKLDIKGRETESLDKNEALRAAERLKGHVDAVAISGYASVRNPEHELHIKKVIADKLSLPVVCAHELSSQLGYYDRTVTAALNAGLIPIIGDLIGAVKTVMKNKGIDAPVMIVKGDGSLMRESFALDKPIETILSGPAASMIGAVYLTNRENAFVLDMGGTTTDTAVISKGKAAVKKSGAMIGGWSPQIQAADIRAFGIGGDSRIGASPDGEIVIGPKRVLPLCAAGNQYRDLIRELEMMISDDGSLTPETGSDCFALIRIPKNIKLNKLEKRIVSLLQNGAHSLHLIAETLGKKAEELDTEKLESRDIIQRIALTPTDLLHVSGAYRIWDSKLSNIGTEILARQMKMTSAEFIEAVTCEITEKLLAACREGIPDSRTFFKERPLVAIGAPVKAWLPAVSDKLNALLIIPEHAEVANAIGAAVGRIVETAEILIRPEKESGWFILYAPWGRRRFKTWKEAVDYGVPAVRRYASETAEKAGGSEIEVEISQEDFYIDNYSESEKNVYRNEDPGDRIRKSRIMGSRCHGLYIGGWEMDKLAEMTQKFNTQYWNDSCSIKELTYAIERGATGATTNPV